MERVRQKLVRLAILTVILLCSGKLVQAQQFCATNSGTNLIFCNDFSGLDPLSKFTINSPISAVSSLTASITNETLSLELISNQGDISVRSKKPLEYTNVIYEAEGIFLTTNSSRKGSLAIQWESSSSSNSPSDQSISFGINLASNYARLAIIHTGTNLLTSSISYGILANTVYKLTIEIAGSNRLKTYINDIPLHDTSVDLSSLRNKFKPAMYGLSDGDQIIFDNLIVRNLEPESSGSSSSNTNITQMPTGSPSQPVVQKGVLDSLDLEARISWIAAADGNVSIKVFTANGLFINSIFDASVLNGENVNGIWDLRNVSGELVANGYYVFQIKAPTISKLIPIVLRR